MRCRLCNGKGGWSEDFGEGTVLREECPPCNGTGEIGLSYWLQWTFWDHAPEWFFEWWADTFHPAALAAGKDGGAGTGQG